MKYLSVAMSLATVILVWSLVGLAVGVIVAKALGITLLAAYLIVMVNLLVLVQTLAISHFTATRKGLDMLYDTLTTIRGSK